MEELSTLHNTSTKIWSTAVDFKKPTLFERSVEGISAPSAKHSVFMKPLAADMLSQTVLIACERKALSENYLFFIYCAMKRLTPLTVGSLFEGVHPTFIVFFLLIGSL